MCIYLLPGTTIELSCATIVLPCTTLLPCTTIILPCTLQLLYCIVQLLYYLVQLLYCFVQLLYCLVQLLYCLVQLLYCLVHVFLYCSEPDAKKLRETARAFGYGNQNPGEQIRVSAATEGFRYTQGRLTILSREGDVPPSPSP